MVRRFFDPDLAKSAGLDDKRFPENKVEGDIAEEALRKELAKLSLNEHEKLVFDKHGFSAVQEEDPSNVESSLQELECELNKIDTKVAYNRATLLNKAYVEDKRFRLLFLLRREFFNAKEAAELMVLHFEIKQNLFGDGEALARDIRLSDLNERATKFLESGFQQQLATKDASGRTVVCTRPLLGVEASDEDDSVLSDINRAVWYFHMATLVDEETSKKGVIVAIFNCKGWKADVRFVSKLHAVKDGVPSRMVALHYCFNDEDLKPFVAGLTIFLERDARVRVRQHFGDTEEMLFELQTFGVPTEVCPMQQDGSWSVTGHQRWMAMHRAREEATSGANSFHKKVVIAAGRFDVLFGRSKTSRNHTGNQRLLHLCETTVEEYESASKGEKTVIANRLISVIRQYGGRFLKRDESGLIEVEDGVARAKIAHFFRHMRSKSKPTGTPRTSEKRKTPAEPSD